MKTNKKLATSIFCKNFTNCECGEWLLVNEKVNKKLVTSTFCKNVVK